MSPTKKMLQQGANALNSPVVRRASDPVFKILQEQAMNLQDATREVFKSQGKVGNFSKFVRAKSEPAMSPPQPKTPETLKGKECRLKLDRKNSEGVRKNLFEEFNSVCKDPPHRDVSAAKEVGLKPPFVTKSTPPNCGVLARKALEKGALQGNNPVTKALQKTTLSTMALNPAAVEDPLAIFARELESVISAVFGDLKVASDGVIINLKCSSLNGAIKTYDGLLKVAGKWKQYTGLPFEGPILQQFFCGPMELVTTHGTQFVAEFASVLSKLFGIAGFCFVVHAQGDPHADATLLSSSQEPEALALASKGGPNGHTPNEYPKQLVEVVSLESVRRNEEESNQGGVAQKLLMLLVFSMGALEQIFGSSEDSTETKDGTHAVFMGGLDVEEVEMGN